MHCPAHLSDKFEADAETQARSSRIDISVLFNPIEFDEELSLVFIWYTDSSIWNYYLKLYIKFLKIWVDSLYLQNNSHQTYLTAFGREFDSVWKEIE